MFERRKIFIDCGTHMFQGFQEFAKKYNIDSSWECYCFEPNPLTYNQSKKIYEELSRFYNITHLNEAVSNKNEEINIKCSKVVTWGHQVEIGDFTDQSSNILDNPQEWWNSDYLEYKVNSINLSSFIKNLVENGDYVLIKMDIEGSEFSVLDTMIEDNTINLVNEIYVEFHERHFDNQEFYRDKKNNYFKILKDNNISLFEWG